MRLSSSCSRTTASAPARKHAREDRPVERPDHGGHRLPALAAQSSPRHPMPLGDPCLSRRSSEARPRCAARDLAERLARLFGDVRLFVHGRPDAARGATFGCRSCPAPAPRPARKSASVCLRDSQSGSTAASSFISPSTNAASWRRWTWPSPRMKIRRSRAGGPMTTSASRASWRRRMFFELSSLKSEVEVLVEELTSGLGHRRVPLVLGDPEHQLDRSPSSWPSRCSAVRTVPSTLPLASDWSGRVYRRTRFATSRMRCGSSGKERTGKTSP